MDWEVNVRSARSFFPFSETKDCEALCAAMHAPCNAFPQKEKEGQKLNFIEWCFSKSSLISARRSCTKLLVSVLTIEFG